MSKLETLYTPTGEAVREDIWGSGGFSSGKWLHEHRKDGIQKPQRFFSQKYCDGIKFARDNLYEAPVISTAGYNISNPEERVEYFGEVLDWTLENPPEVIALSGFNLIIPETVFEKLNKEGIMMLNVHPADLAKMRYKESGRILDAGTMSADKISTLTKSDEVERAYTGNDAVYLAMVGGESELMSTIHRVTPGTDAGSIITRKPRARKVDIPFVKKCIKFGDFGVLEQYKKTFQNHMKDECDCPAYGNAFKILHDNKIEMDPETETLFFNGKKQPYGGILMEAE